MIEIAITVFIMLLLLALAIPSLSGVLADRRLRRSVDELNNFVQTAHERSVKERRPYLIEWQKDQLVLRPETATKDDDSTAPLAALRLRKGDAFLLSLPAALIENAPSQWIFWPSGTCEPAVITFKGPEGSWTARYSPLTALADLTSYGTH